MRIRSIISFSLFLLISVSTSYSQGTTKNENSEINNVNDSVQKIDIGGYSLYTKIYGKGSPTVIFECGDRSSSEGWKFVQPEIAKITRTFSYDRPGNGNSDKSPLSRTAMQQVHELRMLLEKTKIESPYIFVASSYGALISKLFAYMYPDKIAGIVFVDGASEKFPEYLKEHLSFLKFQFLKFAFRSSPDGNIKELFKSAQEIKEAAKTDGIRNIPLIVLTSDIQITVKRYEGLITINDSPLMGWHNEMAALSNKSKHYIIYGTGHLIHMENPKVVIKAITKLLHNEYKWNETSSESNQIISLPPEKMKQYVGRYLWDVDDVLTIKEENGHFYANMPYFPKAEIFSVSEQKVIIKDNDFTIKIVTQQEPKSDYLVISGKYVMDTIFATRIDENYHTPFENLILGNINDAITAYKDIHKTDPLNTAVAETRFNTMGYDFLSKEKINEAIAIFKLNTELYPQSANAYDSLGEAYMKTGDKKNAIKNYKKSLELNSENDNAKQMLKELEKIK